MADPPQSTGLVSDCRAHADLLNFSAYTDALVDIIRSSATDGSLGIGLFGTRGSGKFSLMGFVQEKLGVPAADGQPSFRVAFFDAWKYEKEDALWRALGWQSQHTFEQALEKTVEWYVNNEWWWRKLKSEDYREYYQKQYAERLQNAMPV